MKLRIIVLCGMLAVLACWAADEIRVDAGGEQPVKPERLRLVISGSSNTNYSVELTNDAIVWTMEPRVRGAVTVTNTVTPTLAQWREFRDALDQVNMWKWKSFYKNFDVKGDTQWTVEISYTNNLISGRYYVGSGVNCYPDASGMSNTNGQVTDTFADYLAAVRKLAGGREFK